MKGAPVWFVNATMAPSGKGQQKPKYSSPKPKPKPKNKVAQQLLQRSRETASSHSFYLSIPPLCLFFQPLIYVSIYLQYYPSFSLWPILSLSLSLSLSTQTPTTNGTHNERRNMETPRIHHAIKTKESTPPNPTLFLSHQWPSWTKIYVEERKTKKKEWENKRKRS